MASLALRTSPAARHLHKVMSNPHGLSYSAALSQGLPASNAKQHTRGNPPVNPQQPLSNTIEQPNNPGPNPSFPKRRPSPSHLPHTTSPDESVYVLTLLTDKALHERMTHLRKTYFPPRINKLAAHLTLFHALPASRLESSIIPTLQRVTEAISRFRVKATEPFRLGKGFAIAISRDKGGSQAEAVHRELQKAWKGEGWLSQQDAGACRVHYTLMNKADGEEQVQRAWEDLQGYWKGDEGVAMGLALWKYDRGFWKWERKFEFRA